MVCIQELWADSSSRTTLPAGAVYAMSVSQFQNPEPETSEGVVGDGYVLLSPGDASSQIGAAHTFWPLYGQKGTAAEGASPEPLLVLHLSVEAYQRIRHFVAAPHGG